MWCDCDIVMILLLRGCLGAGESVGLPLYQLSPPETPQPGGRAGQAGAGPHQQEGEDPGQEQGGLRGLLEERTHLENIILKWPGMG